LSSIEQQLNEAHKQGIEVEIATQEGAQKVVKKRQSSPNILKRTQVEFKVPRWI
jgi:hypothetical protein